MRSQPVLEQVEDPGAVDGRGDEQIDRVTEVTDEWACRVDLDDLSVALELPQDGRAAREAYAQTCVVEQLARMARPSVSFEVGRRSR